MIAFGLRSPHATQASPGIGRGSPPARVGRGRRLFGLAWPYLGSAAAVIGAAGIGIGLTSLARLPNVSMVFLLAVLFAAARFGIWPASLEVM